MQINHDNDHKGNKITNVGSLGVGLTAPVNKFDTVGSIGFKIHTTAAASYALAIDDYTVNLSLATSQTLILPAASLFPRRVINVVNTRAVNKLLNIPFSTLNNTSTTTIPSNASLMLQSDGTAWRQVDGGYLPLAERIGRIIVDDVGAGGTATVVGGLTSATKTSPLLSGTSTIAVTMPAMPNTNYNVFLSVMSNGTAVNDTELKALVVIASTITVTGFSFLIEEVGSLVQNITIMVLVKAY